MIEDRTRDLMDAGLTGPQVAQIARTKLGPDETLVLVATGRLDDESAAKIKDIVTRVTGHKRVLVVPEGTTFHVLEEIAANHRADALAAAAGPLETKAAAE